jgi:glucosamine-6-phosphate deaminase
MESNIKRITEENYEEIVIETVGYIKALIQSKPDAMMCLPTGNTPTGVYNKLIELFKKGELDFSEVKTFNLDEYVDISPTHPSSFRYYMNETFFNHVNIKKENIHFPPSTLSEGNILEKCQEYDQLIEEAGGFDIALLGIGRNGHIGFNEPTSSIQSGTRIKTLTFETLSDNDIEFEDEEIPDLVVTMGIGTIMKADKVLLMASGINKADAVKNTVEGPISAFCPASSLQLHKKVKIILDEDSSSLLERKSYYKKVYRRTLYVRELLESKGYPTIF